MREINATYWATASGHVTKFWEQICADHEEEFPKIHQCEPGTFNVLVSDQPPYLPPDDEKYRAMARERGRRSNWYADGNHISPRAKVVAINNKEVEAWIYRGGHTDKPVLELLSPVKLSEKALLRHGDAVALLIDEPSEGSPGMPCPPPAKPGRRLETPLLGADAGPEPGSTS